MGNPTARATHDMLYEMSQQDQETYLANMINENEDSSHVEYEMEETNAFVVGATSDPNPTKKKKKGKTPKARGLAFLRYEDILLVQYWWNATLDPISDTEQKGRRIGRRFGRTIITRGAAVAATLYHETEKRPFSFSHCWLLLDGKPKWQQVVADVKAEKKRNDGSSSHQSIGLDDDDDNVVVTKGKATMPKERMEWDRTKAERRLQIEREKIELEKQEAAIKWKFQKAKTFGDTEQEKERLQLSGNA
ncbi:hypothetical protein D1007_57377 [Hordeum vulgare]|nr:hypothetical protein D1007_57377 [Hordeum vulgare]